METYHIDIDSFIGGWGYSQEYVKNKLNDMKGKPVLMRMNSMGGSLSHGLSMADRIQEHGDVTVHMMGFNASAATIACLKAKKVMASPNGFYLIHKVMSPVIVWENLNSDQLESLIQDLIADKLENDKIDQVMAQMYANKTGKSMQEMLDLMKVGGWMTNEEAQKMGFIDELLPEPEKINMVPMREKLNAFGLPTTRTNSQSLFSTQNNKVQMKKQPQKINAILDVDKLESDKDGVYLNETQVESIETRLNGLEAEVVTERTAKESAESRATTAEATVSTQATKIQQLEAQVENLKRNPGETTEPINKGGDEVIDANKEDGLSNTIKNSREIFDMLPA